ncbi:ABC transporter permease subunit [bacterium]|nr:ABC transporter permease subunit [bacterium]
MSQVDTTTAAVPIRPWVASRSSQAKGLVAPLMIGIAAYLIVLFTGFAGADGWALLFFWLILAVSFVRSRKLGKTKLIVQSMSGVPSIVAGLFIFTTVVVTTQTFSGFAGSLALSILMLPTVARTAEEVLKLVPEDLRSASYALGARQWRSSLMVVLPTVRSGLTTAAILGVSRVIGETAPLILTAQSISSFKFNPFSGQIASIPMYIFALLQIGTEYSMARAWSGALVLMTIVFLLFVVARRLGGKDKR